jgi:hypothetical protein
VCRGITPSGLDEAQVRRVGGARSLCFWSWRLMTGGEGAQPGGEASLALGLVD